MTNNSNGSKRELRYIKEFAMLAILGLVAWSLMVTVQTKQSVAVLDVKFEQLKFEVKRGTKDRYTSEDAMRDIKRLEDLINNRRQ